MLDRIQSVKKFLQEVANERKKITWPSKELLTSYTAVVILVLFISSIAVITTDYFIHKIINLFVNLKF